MKRILVLLSVVALMVVMLLSAAMPAAFARPGSKLCNGPQQTVATYAFISEYGLDLASYDQNGDQIVCFRGDHEGEYRVRDDRLPKS
jgi:hypothetical protein